MFEDKIRKCLCGKNSFWWNRKQGWLGCANSRCETRDIRGNTMPEYQAVNQWNLANTPPEDITHLKYYYARFDMTLPGLEEVSK